MPTLGNRRALLALAVLAAPALAHAAAAAGLKHERFIYKDAAGGALAAPEAVACDDSGALVVADTGNARLLTYTWKDGTLNGGAALEVAELSHPGRVQLDGRGQLFALDRKTRRIVRLDAKGVFAGHLEVKGGAGEAKPVIASFALDAAGRPHLLDLAGRRVLVVDGAGQVVREVGLPPDGGVFTDVAVDASGTLYALDAVGAAVWAAAAGAKGFTLLAPSLKDRIAFPTSITADHGGKLLLADTNGHAIVVLGVDGSYQGRELAVGSTAGLVSYPTQICVNRLGDAFVADRNNNRIQVFTRRR